MEQAAELFGSFDGNMKQLEQRYGVALVFRDSELKITGEDPEAVDKAARVVKSLITLIGGGETLTDVVVPEVSIFVMGDNRNHSSDSRDVTLGAVDERYVLGRALWIILPFDHFGAIPDGTEG